MFWFLILKNDQKLIGSEQEASGSVQEKTRSDPKNDYK